jgi:hypothetical protein
MMSMPTPTPLRPPPEGDRFKQIGFVFLLLFVAALQFSIAVADIFLSFALLMWLLRLVTRRTTFDAPAFFIPLAAYAAATLISVAFSSDRLAGLVASKQLVLFLIVPMVYDFARDASAPLVVQVIISMGAISAAVGVVEYGIFHFDSTEHRVRGSLGHYMTYSGLLMLVICAAAARLLFTRDRLWPLLIMPALVAALAASFSRNAWVGTCAGVAFLLFMKGDLRLIAVVPMVAALILVLAPPRITDRVYSIFDPLDVTRLDRIAMLHVGKRMIARYPLTGVGPTMVQRRYLEFLAPDEDQHVNPHLHNVPVQIAAERGLPALAVWLWFIVTLVVTLMRRLKIPESRFLAAAAISCVIAMLVAGQFEYNFGDSEFLMLFLVLMTLPFAVSSPAANVHA